eukprot:gene3888-4264_t
MSATDHQLNEMRRQSKNERNRLYYERNKSTASSPVPHREASKSPPPSAPVLGIPIQSLSSLLVSLQPAGQAGETSPSPSGKQPQKQTCCCTPGCTQRTQSPKFKQCNSCHSLNRCRGCGKTKENHTATHCNACH